MAGEPKKCREYAWRCSELAEKARTPRLKQTLLDLSKTWLKLALEIERSHALVNMDDPPAVVPRKK